MKLRYLAFLLLAFPFVAHAQKGTNCISIISNQTGDAITSPRWWIAQEIQTYEVQCWNDSTNKLARTLQNQVTGYGQGGLLIGSFGTEEMSCNPRWFPTQQDDSNGVGNSYFQNGERDGVFENGNTNTAYCYYRVAGFDHVNTSYCGVNNNCPINGSPIVLDVSGGKGFVFTSATDGVTFDIQGNGKPIKLAWTAANAMEAFLCLPDLNGKCDTGNQLFGNQHAANGFIELRRYDEPQNGGNGDGIIDAHDAIWPSLRLFLDVAHTGKSEGQLHSLEEYGIHSISLKYRQENRIDQYGNRLRDWAKVDEQPNLAVDVFFVTCPK